MKSALIPRLRPFGLALAASLACVPQVQAQSLVQIYEAARQHDAGFMAAKAQFEATLAKANQALGGILPNIALNYSYGRSEASVRTFNPETTNSRHHQTESGAVTMAQPLYRPAAWATYRQGGRQLLLAAAQFEAAEQDLLVRVSQAYFDVLTSEDALAALRAQKTAVGEQLAAAKRNFEVGASPITGVRDAQARYDLTVAQEIAAENDLRVKRLALDLVSGLTQAAPKRLATTGRLIAAPKEDLNEWVSQAESLNPGVKQAELAREVAQLEVDKQVAGHKPTVDLQFNYSQVRNIGGTLVSPLTNYATIPTAQVVASLPLFAGFSTQYKIQEAQSLAEKAQADLLGARRNAAQATRTAYLGFVAGLSQVKALEAAEVSSQSSLDANKLGYSVGVNINIDVLNAQCQFFQTKRDLTKARHDALMASLKLRQAAGTLTPQDLEPINQLLAP